MNNTTNKTLQKTKKPTEVDPAAYQKIPMIEEGFDSRALPTIELKENYLKYRWSLQKGIWCSWPRLIIIVVWATAAVGFGVLMFLSKTNPALARRIIDFFKNF